MEAKGEDKRYKYFLDLAYLEKNNRSFAAMIWGCLCSKCRGEIETKPERMDSAFLLSTINNCCSKAPNFIALKMPLLEKLFRIFLASGNQPMGVAELKERLKDYWGSPMTTSEQTILRLLKNNRYYGFCQYSVSNLEGSEEPGVV